MAEHVNDLKYDDSPDGGHDEDSGAHDSCIDCDQPGKLELINFGGWKLGCLTLEVFPGWTLFSLVWYKGDEKSQSLTFLILPLRTQFLLVWNILNCDSDRE